MTPLLNKLPEPVKAPLRRIKHRVQNALMERFFHKDITLERLNRIFMRHRYWYQATYADNQLISRHNCDFVTSDRFARAYAFARSFTSEERALWGVYLLQWAAQQAARLPGDYVECGTARGFAAATVLSTVDLAALGKRFFLFDSWSGVLPEQLTEGEKQLYGARLQSFIRDYSGRFEEVRRAFEPYPFVRLVRGYIPETLAEADIAQAAFLHIDLNAAYPEAAALKHFWPKLVQGGWVVLDDYGQPGRGEQKRAMDRLGSELGFEVFASPTGQGLIVKH
jgi:hypothetical protein